MTALEERSSDRVLIVIVNYRTAGLVIECLQSLEREILAYPGSEAIVVDNNSGDGSLEELTSAIETSGWQGWASVLPSGVNGGFASGNNLAIRLMLKKNNAPAFVWMLNSDTTVYPGAMQALVTFAKTKSDGGIFGSLIMDEAGASRFSFRFPNLPGQVEDGLRLGFVTTLLRNWKITRNMTTVPEIVDWVVGASMLVRSKVFEDVGLLDEGYFLYFEETDFCLRAKNAGWKCWYVPDSLVYHIAGQSTGVANAKTPNRRLPSYWFDSRRRYFLKNHGLFYAVLADVLWVSSLALWRLRRAVQHKVDNDPEKFLYDAFFQSVIFMGYKRNLDILHDTEQYK